MSEESNQEKADYLEGTIKGYDFKVKKYVDNGNIIGTLFIKGKKVSL
jgi:hypothetical protein